jgi:hypothetical protein
MKAPTLLVCLAFSLLAPASLNAAEARAAVAAPAKPAQSLAGEYAGKWKGENEVSGNLRLKLSQDKEGKWSADAAFSYEGAEVPTTTKSVKVDGGTVELVMAWEIQGVSSSTKLMGELKDGSLQGKYESATSESAATGTWSAKRK